MADVVLFHSILGLRAAEAALAARVRAAGHRVVTPDLYEGLRTDSNDAGFRLHDAIGDEALLARARAAVAPLPQEAVLAGVSMGCGVAAELWAGRPAAAGVLFLHGVGPVPEAPRRGLPLQVHLAAPDPYEGEDWVEQVRADAGRAGVAAEIFRYPGAGHYFTDPSLPDHDPAAAELAWSRLLAFLGRL